MFFMVGFASACAVLALLFVYYTQQKSVLENIPTQTSTVPVPPRPAIVIKNITLREVEKKKGYELVVTAQESKLHTTSDVVECSGVSGSILQHGDCVAMMRAEKSLIDRLAHHVVFTGQVSGFFKELDMSGSDICYNFSTQMVSTDKTITYTHPQFLLAAHKSVMDIGRQKISLSKGVRSEFFMSCDNQQKP
jgi:hypothetical protein